MEKLEKGINLTDFHFKQWYSTTVRHLKIIILIFLVCIGLFSLLQFKIYQQQEILNINQQETTEKKSKLRYLNERLAKLQSPVANNDEFIPKTKIEVLTKLIKNIPIKNAGLSLAKIYTDKSIILKLAGSYESQQDLSLLKNYLIEQNFEFSVEYTQTNDKGKIEFSLFVMEEK